jgi:hypothetical protein
MIRGLKKLASCLPLARDRTLLILEDNGSEVVTLLEANGYATEKIAGSSNRIFRPIGSSQDSSRAPVCPHVQLR